MEVVSVLKELPIHVRMVCGRNIASQDPLCPIDTAQHQAAFQTRVSRAIASAPAVTHSRPSRAPLQGTLRENLCSLVEHPRRVTAELVAHDGSARKSKVGRFLGFYDDHGHGDRRESKQNEVAFVGTADRSGDVEFRAANYRIG